MIALIEIGEGGSSQHVMVDLHHDDLEQAKADLRKLIREYYKGDMDMSLGDFLYENMDGADYFPIYVDIDEKDIRVDGEKMEVAQ